jgi:hypothetical protein
MVGARSLVHRVLVALGAASIALGCSHASSSEGGVDPASSAGASSSSSGSSANGAPGASSPGVPIDPSNPVNVMDAPDATTVTASAVVVRFDKQTGTLDVAIDGATRISGAYASVDLGGGSASGPGGYVTSKQYTTHAFSSATGITENGHAGMRVTFTSEKAGLPSISQIVTVFDGLPYLYVEEAVTGANGAPVSSSYLGALIVDAQGAVVAPKGSDVRVLDAPFDNDDWVRWDSRVVGNAPFDGEGYEVGAIYESTSREALVFGSVTHDFWKTGIYYAVANGAVSKLNVFGGAATPDTPGTAGATYGEDGTHDTEKHGAMTASVIRSPKMFVGHFADFRDGLVEYGRANARIAPAKSWAHGAPFGWMTWGAYGSAATTAQVDAASQFLKTTLQPQGFENDGTVYINIDATGSVDHAAIVAAAHGRGQKVGTYMTPFAAFGSASLLAKTVGTTKSTYADIMVKDHTGAPLLYKGAYAIDVTHPDAKTLLQSQVDAITAAGYDFVKLDFVTHGILEGKRHDASVVTGVQAYNLGMAQIAAGLGPDLFVSLSIAPIFPSQWGHARRVSCDVSSQLNDVSEPTYPHYGSTEYMLNGLTFGSWMAGTIYPFVDPDAMALYSFEGMKNPVTDVMAQTRVIASAIAGAPFLDTTDTTNATASARETSLLTHPGVLALAKKGRAFMPVEGGVPYVRATIPGQTAVNAGSSAADAFVLVDGGTTYVALFNYDAANAATRTIDVTRLGLPAHAPLLATDVWSGQSIGAVTDTLTVALAPGEAKIVALVK